MRRFSLIAFLLLPFLAQAQFSENVQSDRPGQTYSANTVGKRTLQIQAGYVFNELESKSRSHSEYNVTSHYGNLYLRFGLFEKTEIGGQISFGRERVESIGFDYYDDETDQNVEQFGFAIRQNLLGQENNWLNLTLIADYFNDLQHGVEDAYIFVAASKSITERFNVAMNVGYGVEHQTLLTLNGSFMPTEKLGIFVEYAPNFSEINVIEDANCYKMRDSNLNTGLFYQITPNLMVDAAAYFETYNYRESNYNFESSNFSFQIGLTNRLNWRK